MKLTYEQYRMLAQMGPANDKIVLKNKKGQILKSANYKWDHPQKETKSMCMEVQQRPSPAPTVNHFLTCPHPSSLPRLQPRGKR